MSGHEQRFRGDLRDWWYGDEAPGLIPATKEIVVFTDTNEVSVGDGTSAGGNVLQRKNRRESIAPNQISANADNFAPSGLKHAGLIIMSADADRDLTGIDITKFPDGVGDRLISIGLESTSPGTITIKDQSANSSAVNRFMIGRDIRMVPGSIQTFQYRASVNRWFFFGAPATALTYTPMASLRASDVQSAIDSLAQRFIHVTSVNLNTPPVSPAISDTYVVGTSPTGAWAANAKAIAVCSAISPGVTWAFVTPANDKTIVYNRDDGALYRYTSSAWAAIGSGINDTSVLAIKLDTSTSAKKKDFRTAIGAAPAEALGALNLFPNPGMEGGNEGAAAAITLTATSTLQTAAIVDGCQAWYRGSFVAAMQQVASPFIGGRYAIKTTVSLAQGSLGSNDELSIVFPIAGVRSAKLAFGGGNAANVSAGFWWQSHRTGPFSASVRNKGKTRSYPIPFTITTADTPQWIPVADAAAIAGDQTGTWDIDTGVGMYITVCLAGGTARVGTGVTWAAADYSGVTGTTNGVAATSDVFYVGNAIMVPGNELPSTARAAFGMIPYNLGLRVDGPQSLVSGQQDQGRVNLSAFGVIRIQPFLNSSTYTPHPNMGFCIMRAVGGGGGGGAITGSASNVGGASGGGAGGYSETLATAADIGASKSVTIGAAGSGGAAGNNAGGNGGQTSVGSLCIANGGTGGGSSNGSTSSAGASGGTVGTGNIEASSGAPGTGVYSNSNTGNGGGLSGVGGSSRFGGGGSSQFTFTSVNAGNAATGRGGGGGGASYMGSSSTAAGGAGTAGYVVIIEFCTK